MKEFETVTATEMHDAPETQALQLKLEFTLAEQRALLARLRARKSVLVSKNKLAKIAKLLEQVELCVGQRDLEGYKQISRELLAARLEATPQSVTTWAKLARALHVLSINKRRSADGMRPEIWWRGEWGNLLALVQSHDDEDLEADEWSQSYATLDGDGIVQSHDSEPSGPTSARPVAESSSAAAVPRRPADRFPEAGSNEPASGVLPPTQSKILPLDEQNFTSRQENFCAPKNQNQSAAPLTSNCNQQPNGGARGEILPVEGQNFAPAKDGTHGTDRIYPSHQSHFRPPQRSSRHFVLALSTLELPDRLDEWFDWACARGKALAREKLEVFAVARSIARRASDMRNPPGSFYKVVTCRLWTKIDPLTGRPKWEISNADEEWARGALRELARGDDFPPRPKPEYEP